jgi:hypothetical protein
MDSITINCPHCDLQILINKNEINCKIFRHGIYKDSYIQIDPHMNKEKCNELINNNSIYGCGKPFELIVTDDYYTPIICDYK